MKTVRKKVAAVTGATGFFSGKVSSSVALPIPDVEAQEDELIIPCTDEAAVRVVMNDDDAYLGLEPEPPQQTTPRFFAHKICVVIGIPFD
jgi:hypothetical protein